MGISRVRQGSEGKQRFTSRRRTEARNCPKVVLFHQPDLLRKAHHG
jgi:hypothetical protein